MFKHLYPYQTTLVNDCWLSQNKKVVMGACCNSGKTIMSISFTIEWLK